MHILSKIGLSALVVVAMAILIACAPAKSECPEAEKPKGSEPSTAPSVPAETYKNGDLAVLHVLSSQIAPALVFGDKTVAQQAIAELQGVGDIVMVVVEDGQGVDFASVGEPPSSAAELPPPDPELEWQALGPLRMVKRDFADGGVTYGTLIIVFETKG